MRSAFYFVAFTISFVAMDIRLGMTERLHSIDEYLHTQLASYELIQPDKFISKRDAEEGTGSEHLHFSALNKRFHLVLKPNYARAVLNSLEVLVVQNNTAMRLDYKSADLFSNFYKGYVDEDRNSRVSGYKDNGRFHLTIYEDSDVLNIEPLSLLTGNLSDMRLLVYYDSSISGSQYRCGMDSSAASSYSTRRRRRRSTPTKTSAPPVVAPTRVCRLQVVADHTFVGHVGSVPGALKFLTKATDDVNEIFLASEFLAEDGEVFRGFGFELSSLVAMAGPTSVPASQPLHFNAIPKAKEQMPARRLLDAFGDTKQNGLDFQPHCLSHLATFRRISDSVLGLAYQGSSAKAFLGGLCSAGSMSSFGRGRQVARNLGLTTFCNRDGATVLTRQAILVMAHELAHNLGSGHDPPAGECNPGPRNGGHFLLHEKSVSGQDPNHNLLSLCTRQQIGEVLQSRQKGCFIDPTGQVCGNSRREATEDCDAGTDGDACCGPDCRFRPGAVCSDANAACCQGCRPASAGTVCRRAPPLWPCHADAVCDGRSSVCPPAVAVHRPEGAACLLGVGVCQGGSCRTPCQLAGLRDCRCPEPGPACRMCCAGAGSGANCSAISSGRANHSSVSGGWPGCDDDTGGLGGGLAARVLRMAGASGGSSMAAALRWNIVFVVILLSLLVWVPVCSVIEYRAQPFDSSSDDDEV